MNTVFWLVVAVQQMGSPLACLRQILLPANWSASSIRNELAIFYLMKEL